MKLKILILTSISILLISNFIIAENSSLTGRLNKIYEKKGFESLITEKNKIISSLTNTQKIKVLEYVYQKAALNKKYNYAFAILNDLTKLTHNEYTYSFKKADLFFEIKESNKAENILFSLLSKSLTISQYTEIANMFSKYGLYNQAISTYKAARVRFKSKNIFSSPVIMLYEIQNKYHEAIAEYLYTIRSNKRNIFMQNKLSGLVRSNNLYKQFIKSVTNSKLNFSDIPEIIRLLSESYFNINEFDAMITYLKKYYSLTKNNNYIFNLVNKIKNSKHPQLAAKILITIFKNQSGIMNDKQFFIALTDANSNHYNFNYNLVTDFLFNEILQNKNEKNNYMHSLYQTNKKNNKWANLYSLLNKMYEKKYNMTSEELLTYMEFNLLNGNIKKTQTIFNQISVSKHSQYYYNYIFNKALLYLFQDKTKKTFVSLKELININQAHNNNVLANSIAYYIHNNIDTGSIKCYAKIYLYKKYNNNFPETIDKLRGLLNISKNDYITNYINYNIAKIFFENYSFANALNTLNELMDKNIKHKNLKSKIIILSAQTLIKLNKKSVAKKILENYLLNLPNNLNRVTAEKLLNSLGQENI